jgi:hypothetical protein
MITNTDSPRSSNSSTTTATPNLSHNQAKRLTTPHQKSTRRKTMLKGITSRLPEPTDQNTLHDTGFNSSENPTPPAKFIIIPNNFEPPLPKEHNAET